jgi:hypothetical protein
MDARLTRTRYRALGIQFNETPGVRIDVSAVLQFIFRLSACC